MFRCRILIKLLKKIKKNCYLRNVCVKIVGNYSLLYFCFVALCHIFATFRLWGQLYREKNILNKFWGQFYDFFSIYLIFFIK